MRDLLNRLKLFLSRGIWGTDPASVGKGSALLIRFLRLVIIASRDFTHGQLTLRAMSLVYTTILSMVPLLAVSFSVLKAFGVHNQVEPLLGNFLAPLGPQGAEITARIIGFVENIRVGILGSVGFALLFYTVVSLLQKVEDSLNHIWSVRRARSFQQRMSEYLSVLIVGPVLVFTAVGLSASVMGTSLVRRILAVEFLGTAFLVAASLLPYLLVIAAFTFIYVFVPHTRVRFKAALVGGSFAGITWKATGWAFTPFVATTTRNAIYSSFAILMLFMIWLYLSWLILLVGAKISFYVQYPQFMAVRKESLLLGNRLKEKLALFIMSLVGNNFQWDRPPWTLGQMVEQIGLPVGPIQEVILMLQKKGFLRETGDDPPAYLPARDLAGVRVSDLLTAIRGEEEETQTIEERFLSDPRVDDVMRRFDEAIATALGDRTIRDLAGQPDRPSGSG